MQKAQTMVMDAN